MNVEPSPTTLPGAAIDFWKHKTVEELAAEQGVMPYDPAAWTGAPDITDEELDWWLAELRDIRRGSKAQGR